MKPSPSGKKLNKASLTRVLRLVVPQWKTFFLGLLALAAGSGITLFFPEVIRHFAENPTSPELAARSLHVAFVLSLLFAAQAVAFYFRTYLFGLVGQRVVTQVRERLYNIIIREPIEFFDSSRVADLVSRLNSDALMLQDAVSVRLSVFIRYSIQVVVGVVLMSSISLPLTLAIIVILPVLVALSLVLGRRLRRLSKEQQSALGKAAAIAQESFEAIRVVKAFNQESSETARYSAHNSEVLRLGVARASTAAFFSSFVSFLLNCAIILVLLYGVHLVLIGSLGIGDLMAFLLYGVIVAVSFGFLAGGYAELIQSIGASERIFELLDHDRGLPEPVHALLRPDRVGGHFEFQNVCFSYPSRPELPILDNVSFELLPGKTTALVGPSGSGKSTIVNLMLGLYQPTRGEIRIDGSPMSGVDPAAIRDKLALVPQEQALFDLSIAENLRFGKRSATLDELRAVCEKTNMLQFIESLPQGFDTQVGERGVQLSTGQKQRLAIARALLRDPLLLILDEATSALDSENEHLVQIALQTALQGRGALIIAHRLATVKGADRVLVIDRGRIVQEGTHEMLARTPGLYRQLVEKQELLNDSATKRT